MKKKKGVASAWVRRERRKDRVATMLAILLFALLAWMPQNERRLFLLPQRLVAIGTIAPPQPTQLRWSGAPGLFGQRRLPSAFIPAQPVEADAIPPPLAPPLTEAPQGVAIDLSGIPVQELAQADVPALAPPLRRKLSFIRPRPFNISLLRLGPVPEPASWLMMIGGMAFLGATLRWSTARRSKA